MKKTVLVMAGGRGERFWPKSRKKLPKQFLSLTDDGKTMIQKTIDRISAFAKYEDIFISTNVEYKSLVEDQLPEIPNNNIICEPIGRNTAPCIGLAAEYIRKKYDDAIMIVLPSDHMIKYRHMFESSINNASEIACEGNNIVTIGITPTYPETGYGYVKYIPDSTKGNSYRVDRFVEKPNAQLASEYVSSEEYLWNSGMFVWKVSTILESLKKYLPEIYEKIEIIRSSIGTESETQTIESQFIDMPSVSIDYGVLEKAENIFVVPGTFGWDDVGSWLAIERMKRVNESGNVISGNVISIETKDCIVEGTNKLIATVGLRDLIIVDTKDATLVCNKNNVSDIRKVVENLKICNRDEYI